jgi:hypothetical protein
MAHNCLQVACRYLALGVSVLKPCENPVESLLELCVNVVLDEASRKILIIYGRKEVFEGVHVRFDVMQQADDLEYYGDANDKGHCNMRRRQD